MIYVIAEAGEDAGPVKIGFTEGKPCRLRVLERLNSNQTSNPERANAERLHMAVSVLPRKSAKAKETP